jgi:hypothetical protein
MRFFCLIFLLSCSFQLKAQDYLQSLKLKIINADSVLLVSHETIPEVAATNPKTLKPYPLPKLLIKGKPNKTIIKQQVSLNKSQVIRLANLLSNPNDSVRYDGLGFESRHAIFVFESGIISYLDICFACRHLEHSKNIQIEDGDFTNAKWNELIVFFKEQGINFGWSQDE